MQQQQMVAARRDAAHEPTDGLRLEVLRTPKALIADARANRGRVRISEHEAQQFTERDGVRIVVLKVDDEKAGWWLLVQ